MVKEYLIVSLDFDGVLAHGYEAKIRYAKEWFGVDLALHQTKKDKFEELMRELGKNLNYRDLMGPLNEGRIMEYRVPDGCVEVLTRLYSKKCRFVVTTSRNDHDFPYAVKFVDSRFKGIIRYVHNTRNRPKGALIRRLWAGMHVDDDVAKLIDVPNNILRVYYRQPENEHVGGDGFVQAWSFYDLEAIINTIRPNL